MGTQLLDILKFYQDFEIDDQTGTPLSQHEFIKRHYERLEHLQRVCFMHHKDQLEDVALTNISSLDTRDALQRYFAKLPMEVFCDLCARVCHLDVTKDPILSKLLQA